jgi:hypothetical protein
MPSAIDMVTAPRPLAGTSGDENASAPTEMLANIARFDLFQSPIMQFPLIEIQGSVAHWCSGQI